MSTKRTAKTFKPVTLNTTLCPDCHTLIYGHLNIDGTIHPRVANHFATKDEAEKLHPAIPLYQLNPDAGIIRTLTPNEPFPTKRGSPKIWWTGHVCQWDTTPRNPDGIPLIVFTYPPAIPGLNRTQAQQTIHYLNRPPY